MLELSLSGLLTAPLRLQYERKGAWTPESSMVNILNLAHSWCSISQHEHVGGLGPVSANVCASAGSWSNCSIGKFPSQHHGTAHDMDHVNTRNAGLELRDVLRFGRIVVEISEEVDSGRACSFDGREPNTVLPFSKGPLDRPQTGMARALAPASWRSRGA